MSQVVPEDAQRRSPPRWWLALRSLGWIAAGLLVALALQAVALAVARFHADRLWPLLLAVPPIAFGIAVAEQIRAGRFAGRADLTWLLLLPVATLATLQVQHACATVYIEGHADYARELRLGAVLAAAGTGLADIGILWPFKLAFLPALALWDLGWVRLVTGAWLRYVGYAGPGLPAARGAPCTMAIVLGGAWVFGSATVVLPAMIFSGTLGDPDEGFRCVPDDELIATFHREKDACERLRAMLLAETRWQSIGTDRVGRWRRCGPFGWESGWEPTRDRTTDFAEVLADAGLTAERHREYQRLLVRLGAYAASVDPASIDHDCEIRLTRQGHVVRAVHKSFVHSPSGRHPPALVPRPGDPDQEQYTPLSGGWFFRYLDH